MGKSTSKPNGGKGYDAASPKFPTIAPISYELDLGDFEDYRYVNVLDQLARLPAVEVAVDTEYQGTHTLTIQAATRIGEDVAVQVYRSPQVPDLPRSFRPTDYLPHTQYDRFYRKIIMRPVRCIHSELSAAEILLNLVGLGTVEAHDHTKGRWIIHGEAGPIFEPSNGRWDKSRGEWSVPTIRMRMIAHFMTADFGRVFGSAFHVSLFEAGSRREPTPRPFALQCHKLLSITNSEGFLQSPMVQLLDSRGGDLYRLTLETRDTMLPFGSGSLEQHCQTFLGIGKSKAISSGEKEHMLETFHARTADAYGYAVADVVNTLLLHEQMQEEHDRIYRIFGVPHNEIPKPRPTMGSRVADFLVEMMARHAQGSQRLSNRQGIKGLLRRGGARLFEDDPRASVFGAQTAGTHGGLLFSRSPTVSWHDAPGQLRDVDMSACYNRIISTLNVYSGRPVIHEPGDNRLSLKEAVAWAESHAESDAWMVRVTGDLATVWNSLIPSTLDARIGPQTNRRPARKPCGKQGAKLFSKRIESGIVTRATWALIEALPNPMRAEYEQLSAETIVLYPRKLVANSAEEYDALVAQRQHGELGWESEVDIGQLRRTDTFHLDHRYVALRFPIKDVAQRLVEMREKAKAEHGKGSGAEQALKLQANSMYGVLASGHLPTQNFLAANIITATARADAWTMAMVLNGIQIITDGVTYRRDQIPACTFRECLLHCPDYPLRRPEHGEIPFLDPTLVPEDDAAFTVWLRNRARWFFESSDGKPADLLSLPVMEHKRTGETGAVAFDALACDGCGNYIKYTGTSGGYKAHEPAMRGYGRKCREPVLKWILETYSSDEVKKLCPIVTDESLLKLDRAQQAARKALTSNRDEVYLPLGLPNRRPLAFKALKLSAFIFRSPSQFKKLSRQEQRFAKATTCGLELLCRRRKYGTVSPAKLSALATRLYEYIQQDGGDLTKKFHLHRLSPRQARLARKRAAEMKQRRQDAEHDLQLRINARNISPEAKKTGIFVRAHSPLLAR